MRPLFWVILTTILFVGCNKKEEALNYTLQDVSQMSWSEIVETAQQEGSVTWNVWYYQPEFRQLAAEFTNKYGIEVQIPEGTSEGNNDKLIASKDRPVGDTDVIAFGIDSQVAENMSEYLFGSLDFLPQYDTRIETIGGVNSQGYALAYWGNQTGFAYNPKRITFEELPQTLEELQTYMVQNPSQFAFNDPNGGGAGVAFIRSVIRNVGLQGEQASIDTIQWAQVWDWFKQYRDDYVITASNADSLTRLSDGEFIITPAWEDHLSSLQNQGAIDKELQFYIPQMGMAGSGNVAGIPLNAPHPAAAILFLEWLTSAETQTALNVTFGAAPQNSEADSSQALIPAEMRQYSTTMFDNDTEIEAKKQFLQNILVE